VIRNVFSDTSIFVRAVNFHVRFRFFGIVKLEIRVLWGVIPCIIRDKY
jgi:hypothetical protein